MATLRASGMTVAALVLLGGLSAAAQATPLRLQFQPNAGGPGIGSFNIDFNDTGDGLLEASEITAFSGIDVNIGTPSQAHFDTVLVVPDIAGFASSFGCTIPAGFVGCHGSNWIIGMSSDSTRTADIGASRFGTYRTVGGGNVPVPATGALMSTALAVLAWSGRRRDR